MDEPRAPHRLPVCLGLRHAGEGGVAAVVEDAHGPRRHAVLDEVEPHARVRARVDEAAVHAVTGELVPGALTPLIGRQGRDPCDAEPQPRARGRHVRFGAADLHIELAGRLEARRRRDGQAQEDLAQRHQIVHLRGP